MTTAINAALIERVEKWLAVAKPGWSLPMERDEVSAFVSLARKIVSPDEGTMTAMAEAVSKASANIEIDAEGRRVTRYLQLPVAAKLARAAIAALLEAGHAG